MQSNHVARTVPVFVYGTLKRGGPWYERLLKLAEGMDAAEYVGSGMTARPYPMIIDAIPYLLDENGGHQVHGELFKVSYTVIRALDALEQHPVWYERKIKEVLIDGARTKAFIYFLTRPHYRSLGDWRRATYHAVYPIESVVAATR